MKKIKFLGRLTILFKRSKITYKQYLENNNTLLYAKILQKTNLRLRDELIEYSYLLSNPLQQECLKLINHYDIWLEKWNALFKSNNYSIDDSFVFENKHGFPKNSESLLIQEFNKLAGDL